MFNGDAYSMGGNGEFIPNRGILALQAPIASMVGVAGLHFSLYRITLDTFSDIVSLCPGTLLTEHLLTLPLHRGTTLPTCRHSSGAGV